MDFDIQKAKKQMRRQLIILAVCLFVLTAAVIAFISHAWYATNTSVTGQHNNIISETPSPSLFIRRGDDNTKIYASHITSSITGKLFPSSTADLINWYYASHFRYISNTNNGYTINSPYADEYTLITQFIDESTGLYNNTYENKQRIAYIKSIINLYTTTGPLNVYLDENNPIVVEYDNTNTTVQAKQLLDCLRVGISVNNSMKIIYAPMTESGNGNSFNSENNNFYYILNGNLTNANNTVTTNAASTAIGTATPEGLDVEIYIWLEGTDAQALYGLANNDLKGINVTINYIGIEE